MSDESQRARVGELQRRVTQLEALVADMGQRLRDCEILAKAAVQASGAHDRVMLMRLESEETDHAQVQAQAQAETQTEAQAPQVKKRRRKRG